MGLALVFGAAGCFRPALAAQDPAAAPTYQPESAASLQQAVAPLALYPDALVAQILAASTFPEQVVEADRFVQAHPDLKGAALGAAVDPKPWDASVKALTAFPAVLGNMDKNLSWTSALGDAYYNQPQDVMDAVQVMRRRAQAAGSLKTTPQQVVTTQGPTIIIQPEDPNTVYVPAYDPWMDYGAPVVVWPGWYEYPGIWFGGPNLSFGLGFGIGFYGGFAWGFPHWGFDWRNRSVLYNHNRYYSRSNTFYNRNRFYRGGAGPGGNAGRGGFGRADGRADGRGGRAFNGNPQAARGFAEPRGQSGEHSSAFSGYQHGGDTRGFAARGGASMGGAPARGGGMGMARGGGMGMARGGGMGRSAGRGGGKWR
jgi:hypothetical protein